ncbi:hypothetical protein WR25_23784 [Diploscapter pachys]|uniref:Uncharacterized protein n=1 Tax=Diploscapter pachys TaxID=2018661 RepID=A0A2A2JMJ1_9BILA|nr:hypothetical protein WR25_23784 [Diploscapter pachys]
MPPSGDSTKRVTTVQNSVPNPTGGPTPLPKVVITQPSSGNLLPHRQPDQDSFESISQHNGKTSCCCIL